MELSPGQSHAFKVNSVQFMSGQMSSYGDVELEDDTALRFLLCCIYFAFGRLNK